MHILLITHYFAPDSGAAANRLTRLAHMLHEQGHDVTVLTTLPHYPKGIIPPEYRRRFVVTEERQGIRVIQTWLWVSPISSISRRLLSQLTFMMTCSLRSLFLPTPDVILLENQPIFTGLAGWFISRVKGIPYVLNVSDYWPEYLVVAGVVRETSFIYRLFKALANRTQRDATGIVTLLDDLLVKIEARIGKVAQSRVIYNAVDLDVFSPVVDDMTFRLKYGMEDKKLITFLGVLGVHIDLDTMLEAARRLHERQNITFLFVGTGAQKEKLATALQQPDLSHCRWIEWIDFSEIPAFWAASHVNFWALHHNELDKMRFQAKLYEALATGTPVVIAVDGLMSQVLAQHQIGLTVPPYDVGALVAAIETLLDDESTHQGIARRARHYAEQNFDARRAAAAYEAMLQQALQPETKTVSRETD